MKLPRLFAVLAAFVALSAVAVGSAGYDAGGMRAAHPERGEAVVVLQPSELALDGGAGPVEVAEALSVALDAREEAPAESERQGCLLSLRSAGRDDRRLRS